MAPTRTVDQVQTGTQWNLSVGVLEQKSIKSQWVFMTSVRIHKYSDLNGVGLREHSIKHNLYELQSNTDTIVYSSWKKAWSML